MWSDLSSEVQELFSDVRFEHVNAGVSTTSTLVDPHEDADRWLAASDDEREALRPVYAGRLKAAQQRNARALLRSVRKSLPRCPMKQATRMREYRKQADAKAKDNARSANWRQSNRDVAAAYLREWRKRRRNSKLGGVLS